MSLCAPRCGPWPLTVSPVAPRPTSVPTPGLKHRRRAAGVAAGVVALRALPKPRDARRMLRRSGCLHGRDKLHRSPAIQLCAMAKSQSRRDSIVVELVEEPFMAPEQMEKPETFLKESADSQVTSGCAIPNLFGNVDEGAQYYVVWFVPCLVRPVFPEVQQDQKLRKTGEDTPTYLGTSEQSQRLWEASGCPPVEELQPPLEIKRVLDVVAEQQREALRAQHEQVLLALEPVVAERAAEEAKEATEAESTVELPSVPSSESGLLGTSNTSSTFNLNENAPKFRPGMEECPYVAIGQSCRTSRFCGFGRCQSYLEGRCTRRRCKFCHCLSSQ
eukprot:s481_g17.t1